MYVCTFKDKLDCRLARDRKQSVQGKSKKVLGTYTRMKQDKSIQNNIFYS